MLYLIHCEIIELHYLADNFKYTRTHIVEANNSTEAEEKLLKYYEEKEEPYSVSYRVIIDYINEYVLDKIMEITLNNLNLIKTAISEVTIVLEAASSGNANLEGIFEPLLKRIYKFDDELFRQLYGQTLTIDPDKL